MTQQVMCIRKRGNHFNPHERIEGIGGNYPGQWYTIEETAIRNVERDPSTAFPICRTYGLGSEIDFVAPSVDDRVTIDVIDELDDALLQLVF